MNTTNIVSTPNITGNVGSCTTQVVTVTTGRPSFFYEETADISTNSCTGEVQQFASWQITDSAILSAVATGVFLLCALGIWANAESY